MAGLSAKQIDAIAALLSEKDVKSAARKARVAYSTVRDWMEVPEFRDRLTAERNKLLDGLVTNLVRIGAKATASLEAGLDPSRKIETRIRAAKVVLDQLVKIAPLADVVNQINALRLELAGQNADRSSVQPGSVPAAPAIAGDTAGAGQPDPLGSEDRPDPAFQGDGADA